MSDRCLFSFYESSNGKTIDWSDRTIGHEPPVDWSDALKFTSQLTDFTGFFGTVYSGKENCADMNNRCSGVRLHAEAWVSNGGLYPFTVKGGCHNIDLSGKLYGHGKECDVDAGNKSDQSKDWVRDWSLNLVSVDGKPIVIRCLRAEAPRLEPGSGPYRYAFPSPHNPFHGIIVWFLGLIRVI